LYYVLQRYKKLKFISIQSPNRRKTGSLCPNVRSLANLQVQFKKTPSRGTPAKLSHADKLLLLLMYYREYRTQFHIGVTYGISESRVCEIIKETESILIQDSRFHLPGKKALLREENQFEVVLIDVTESPVERPKKNSD
jgi:hypothetical protein